MAEVVAVEAASSDLGFVEPCESWKLCSKYFPSKVGGKPAWLDLRNLPTPTSLFCKRCNEPMLFVLQIYAPIDHKDDCFHRTIYVFMCKKPDCNHRNNADNFAVFRCQMGRKNQFYDFEPPDENEHDVHPVAADFVPLCNVCGCLGPKRCARCHRTSYCSKEHQKIDWKSQHRSICNGENTSSSSALQHFTLPEYEIIIESENDENESADSDNVERSEEDRMKDYENYIQKHKHSQPAFLKEMMTENADTDLMEMATSTADKTFMQFKKKIKTAPDQILRYKRNGTPLWIASESLPTSEDIPNCELCGSRRQFEFQVMPQLLNHFKLDVEGDSIDWGTLVVYTCSQSCTAENQTYISEYLWKQDVSAKNM